jgi:predicted  nucleic acid-binding Zn-ribbon protein
MISTFYIESAKAIRSQFLTLSQQLEKYQGELKQISQLLLDTARELEDYNNNGIYKEKSMESIKNYIVSKLDKLDFESNKLAKKINPINEAIEKLKQDEIQLYQAIKDKYPNLTDLEIQQEIKKHLVE